MLRSTFLLVATKFASSLNDAPSAPFFNFCSTWGLAAGHEDVCLRGLDLDGDALSATVTELPSGGLTSTRSQVYETHRSKVHEAQKAGAAVQAGTTLTTRQNCLLWLNPLKAGGSGCGPLAPGGHCRLTYQVTEQKYKGLASQKGVVTLLDAANPSLGTDFAAGADGWTVVGNNALSPSAAAAPSWEPSTRGLLSYYIHAKDAVIAGQSERQQAQREAARLACDPATGCSDTQQWYFVAPQRFLGFQGMHYGGEIAFSLMSSAGDFAQNNLNDGGRQDLVVLECASCAMNAGITLVVRMDNANQAADAFRRFDGKAKAFRVPLLESEWLKDPKSTLATWQPPTQCEMLQVLSGLTTVKVLGDHTKWHESVALDDFSFVASCANRVLPLKCSSTRTLLDGTEETGTCEACRDGTTCKQETVMSIA